MLDLCFDEFSLIAISSLIKEGVYGVLVSVFAICVEGSAGKF
jgi:hypothetical protein